MEYPPSVERVGGYSICSTPAQLARDGTFDLAVKESPNPVARERRPPAPPHCPRGRATDGRPAPWCPFPYRRRVAARGGRGGRGGGAAGGHVHGERGRAERRPAVRGRGHRDHAPVLDPA